MAVLEGELQEVHFEEGPDGLRERRIKDFPTGGVAYIHDDIALHLIRPKPGALPPFSSTFENRSGLMSDKWFLRAAFTTRHCAVFAFARG